MIAPASLPIDVEVPEDYQVPQAALEAIAMLLIEQADKALDAEQGGADA